MPAERTSAETGWRLGGALAAVVVAMVGWFLVVHPELSRASAGRASVDAARDANAVQQAHVNSLRRQSAKLPALRRKLRAASTALPPSASIDQFTRSLSADADAAHVQLTSITVSTPTVTGTSSAAAGSATPAPAATAPTDAAGRAAAGRTYQVAVSVISSGEASRQIAFLHSVQHGTRAVLVTSAALAGPGGSTAKGAASATLTTTLQVFVAPRSPQDLAELHKLLNHSGSTPASPSS